MPPASTAWTTGATGQPTSMYCGPILLFASDRRSRSRPCQRRRCPSRADLASRAAARSGCLSEAGRPMISGVPAPDAPTAPPVDWGAPGWDVERLRREADSAPAFLDALSGCLNKNLRYAPGTTNTWGHRRPCMGTTPGPGPTCRNWAGWAGIRPMASGWGRRTSRSQPGGTLSTSRRCGATTGARRARIRRFIWRWRRWRNVRADAARHGGISACASKKAEN